MAHTAVPRTEIEPIDRLEDKVRRLIALVDRMKAEQNRAAEETQRLMREVETLRQRVVSSDTIGTELSALRQERDLIRSRVGEMLDQLDALNL